MQNELIQPPPGKHTGLRHKLRDVGPDGHWTCRLPRVAGMKVWSFFAKSEC